MKKAKQNDIDALVKAFEAGSMPPGKGKQVGRVESLKLFPQITAGEAKEFWSKKPMTLKQYTKHLKNTIFKP